MRDITELIVFLKNNYCTKDQLLLQGWSAEEIEAAQTFSENTLRSQPDKSKFWAGVLIPLLLVGIVVAEELPPTIQEWIDSNGTRGSPIAVVEGNITYNNVTITSGSAYDVSSVSAESDQTASSNLAAPINITAVSVNSMLQNVTESNSSGGGAMGPITYILPENLTEEQALLETEPLLKVYAGENKTLYVVDNHKLGNLIRWFIKRL